MYETGSCGHDSSAFFAPDVAADTDISIAITDKSGASMAAQHAAGLITLTAEQITKAEVSGNGAMSTYDASLIAQKALKLTDKFPVEG